MQVLGVIMLWNVPGSSAVKWQHINFAWIGGLTLILNPLFALCQKMREGNVGGNVNSDLQSSFCVWLPGISPVAHTGLVSKHRHSLLMGSGWKKFWKLLVGFIYSQPDCRGIGNKESGGSRKGFKSPAVQIWWRNSENFSELEKFLEVIHSILALP